MSIEVAGLVLAAGLSERMAGAVPKQLLAFGDRTMVGHVVAVAVSTGLDPIVVVTGHAAAEVEATMAPARALFAHNPRYAEGNLSSLRAGLATLGDADAVMLLLADMPGLEREVIEIVAAAWRDQRPFAAVTAYEGVEGHPLVLSSAAVADVSSLAGDKPLWAWLGDPDTEDAIRVEVGRPKPGDVNTIGDYHRELRALGLWEDTTQGG